MITVTRLNGSDFILNDDLIEFIEKTPDTVISMSTGRKVTVKEGAEEVIQKIVQFRKEMSVPDVRDKA
jgi:flagellar protein FlbD